MKNFNQIHSCSVKVIRVLIRHSRISFAFGRNMWFVEQVLTRCKNHDWFTSSHATKYSVFNNLKHGGQGSHFPFLRYFRSQFQNLQLGLRNQFGIKKIMAILKIFGTSIYDLKNNGRFQTLLQESVKFSYFGHLSKMVDPSLKSTN